LKRGADEAYPLEMALLGLLALWGCHHSDSDTADTSEVALALSNCSVDVHQHIANEQA
jgi:hypothetical protein